jgi:hypothetical protein
LPSFGAGSFAFQFAIQTLKIKIQRTIILIVVLYGCDAWSLTLREEPRLSLFEKRVLKRFGCKRDEVTGECRKLHNEELNDLYFSSNIIRVIKSREMGWTGCVARMGERIFVYRVWWGNMSEDHLGDPGVDGRIVLIWIFWKWDVGVWTGSS